MCLVSVVITTYNRPVTILKRALDSVVQQTMTDFEIIVVNDAPKSIELVNEIRILIDSYKKDNIIYIVHAINSGACQARNTGINKAKGKFIAFLDDDDEWISEKLEKQLVYMKDDNVGLVYCASNIVSANGTQKQYTPRKVETNFYEEILRTNFVGSTSFPLLRLNSVKECGMFDIMTVSSQDYDLWIRILKNSEARLVQEPLVNYYLSEDSTFSNVAKYAEGDIYLMNKYKSEFAKYPKAYSYHINNSALNMLALKHKVDVKMYLNFKIKGIFTNPFSVYNYFLFSIKAINKIKRIKDYKSSISI